MGQFVSQEGFDIDDIKSHCTYFLNGHLHNKGNIDNITNLGNLTGQNFSEDATKYSHNCYILDTDTGKLEAKYNMYALNFYKLTINNKDDIDQLDNILSRNAIVNFECNEDIADKVKQYIASNSNIVESRVTIKYNIKNEEQEQKLELTSINPIDEFLKYCYDEIEDKQSFLIESQEIR